MRTRYFKPGLLIFLLSFFAGLLGSGAGFLLGWLWNELAYRNDPSFSNPHLSGLSQGMMALSVFVIWLYFCYIFTILGGILGGMVGARFYRRHNKRP